MHQIIAVHLDSHSYFFDTITGVDFSNPAKLTRILCGIVPEQQRKVCLKSSDTAPRTDYTGDYHAVLTSGGGIEVRGLVGVLFTKEQYNSAQKLAEESNKMDTEMEAESAADNDTARFVLVLSSVVYADGEDSPGIRRKTANVEYSTEPGNMGTREACLIVRTDSQCNMGIIALNSSHKYYCQLILLPTSSLTGTSSSY